MPIKLIQINQIIIGSVLSFIPLHEYPDERKGAHVSVWDDCFIKSCSYVFRDVTGRKTAAGNSARACNLPEYKQNMRLNSPYIISVQA